MTDEEHRLWLEANNQEMKRKRRQQYAKTYREANLEKVKAYQREYQRKRYIPKPPKPPKPQKPKRVPKPLAPMVVLVEQRKYLLSQMYVDFRHNPQGKTLGEHLQNWQELHVEFKRKLINNAMGGRWGGGKIPNRTLSYWYKRIKTFEPDWNPYI